MENTWYVSQLLPSLSSLQSQLEISLVSSLWKPSRVPRDKTYRSVGQIPRPRPREFLPQSASSKSSNLLFMCSPMAPGASASGDPISALTFWISLCLQSNALPCNLSSLMCPGKVIDFQFAWCFLVLKTWVAASKHFVCQSWTRQIKKSWAWHICEKTHRKQVLQFSSGFWYWIREIILAKFHCLISINLLTIWRNSH